MKPVAKKLFFFFFSFFLLIFLWGDFKSTLLEEAIWQWHFQCLCLPTIISFLLNRNDDWSNEDSKNPTATKPTAVGQRYQEEELALELPVHRFCKYLASSSLWMKQDCLGWPIIILWWIRVPWVPGARFRKWFGEAQYILHFALYLQGSFKNLIFLGGWGTVGVDLYTLKHYWTEPTK